MLCTPYLQARYSQPCRKGWYSAHDTRGLCTQCPYAHTTAGVGVGANISDCGIAPGFGWLAAVKAIVPCPIGKPLPVRFQVQGDSFVPLVSCSG